MMLPGVMVVGLRWVAWLLGGERMPGKHASMTSVHAFVRRLVFHHDSKLVLLYVDGHTSTKLAIMRDWGLRHSKWVAGFIRYLFEIFVLRGEGTCKPLVCGDSFLRHGSQVVAQLASY